MSHILAIVVRYKRESSNSYGEVPPTRIAAIYDPADVIAALTCRDELRTEVESTSGFVVNVDVELHPIVRPAVAAYDTVIGGTP